MRVHPTSPRYRRHSIAVASSSARRNAEMNSGTRMGIIALARWIRLPESKSAPRAFWAEMIFSVSSISGRDEAQRDRHHHGKLMYGRVQLFQRREQALQSVGQLDRGRWYKSAWRSR